MRARVLAGTVLTGCTTRTRTVAGRRGLGGRPGLAGRRPWYAETAKAVAQHRAHVSAKLFYFLGRDFAFCLQGGVLLEPVCNGNTLFVGYLRATVAQPLMEHNHIDACFGIERDQRPRKWRIGIRRRGGFRLRYLR